MPNTEQGKKINSRKKKCDADSRRGRLFLVGIGPGGLRHMTFMARDAISRSEIIVGYKTYIAFIKELIHDREIICSHMTGEVERCRIAVELAAKGKNVSLVSSGDTGVYGMAGPVYEIISKQHEKMIDIEVIPGVSSVNAAASCAGAPLMNDFAVISLSDLLTPWDIIQKRISLAAQADFVIAFINPKSRTRVNQIEKARNILLKYRNGLSIIGIIRNAKREGESVVITTLDEMHKFLIDMSTTVIIGNSTTFKWENIMITSRGYII